MINQLTIIGLGKIGKSIAIGIKNAAFTKSLVGFDENQEKAKTLFDQKILNHYRTDLLSAVANADLIVMAIPYDQYDTVFSLLADNLSSKATLLDVASIKTPIIELAKTRLGAKSSQFIPCHPIINSKLDNHLSASPEIFAERPIIITPDADTLPKSLKLVKTFWQKLGGIIEIKTPEENDCILATVSQLPQILAFTFMNGLNEKDKNVALPYMTQHFFDFTHIVAQSPAVWSDICIANRQAILREMSKFESNLKKLKKILEKENSANLLEHLHNVKGIGESI